MDLQGRKVVVNRASKDLFEMLKTPQDYKHLMPSSLVSFEHTADEFRFNLQGMPEVALRISNFIENEKVVLSSVNPSLDFSLTGMINPIAENKTEVQLLFNGNFNPFIKMMVEKPLQNFINSLTDKIELL